MYGCRTNGWCRIHPVFNLCARFPDYLHTAVKARAELCLRCFIAVSASLTLLVCSSEAVAGQHLPPLFRWGWTGATSSPPLTGTAGRIWVNKYVIFSTGSKLNFPFCLWKDWTWITTSSIYTGRSCCCSLWGQPTLLIRPEPPVAWGKLSEKMSASFQTESAILCIAHITHSAIYWAGRASGSLQCSTGRTHWSINWKEMVYTILINHRAWSASWRRKAGPCHLLCSEQLCKDL